MKKVIASAGLIALGVVSLQNARAQMATADKPWTISGTLRGFYDDNYNTQPDGTNRVSSWGFELRPSVTYKLNEGPTTITAAYLYSLKAYTDRPGNKLDQTHEFDVTGNHIFNEAYAADIEESFVSAQEPEVLNAAAPGSAPLRANGDNYHNSVSVNFHDQFNKIFGIVLGYNNNWYDYTGNAPAGIGQPSYGTSLNDMVHTFSLDGRWQLDEETVGIFEYRFAYTDYLSQGSLNPAFVPGVANGQPYVAPSSRNVYAHFIDVGVEHSFRSDFGVNAHVGVQITDYYNYNNALFAGGSNPSGVTPYADLSANYTYTDGGTLTVGFTHTKNSTDVAYNPGNGAPNSGTLTVDAESSTLYMSVVQTFKSFAPNLTGTFSFQVQDSGFNGGADSNTGEDFYLLGLNLTYQFLPNFSGEIGYDYNLLASGLAGRGYDRNRVYVGLTATY